MAVYLFSFHAYRSWMPDHPRGYTRRGEGYMPYDPDMADRYVGRSNGSRSWFDPAVQRDLVERVREACGHLNCRAHGVATEIGHLHILTSWSEYRRWESVRKSLKTSLTRFLNERHPGTALSRGGSRKRVQDRAHFDYLMQTYLPDHPGWGWYEDRGWVSSKHK